MRLNISSLDPISLWREFLDTKFSNGSTINYITSPFGDPALFPILIFIFTIAAFLVLIMTRRSFTRPAMVKAVVISFMLGGFIFAMRMDLNWLVMLKDDYNRFSGKGIDERVEETIGYDLKQFMRFTRETIPAGEKVREMKNDPSNLTSLLTKLGNYYLLPVLSTSDGRFVWIYDFTDYSYDPDTGILKVYDSIVRARLYATYRPGAYVYEVMDAD